MFRILLTIILSIIISISSYAYQPQYVVYVDFSLPSTAKRLFVYENGNLVYSTWVAHGVNSGGLYATQFSNQPGSLESSLGTYITTGVYYSPKHGKVIHLQGLDSSNSNAAMRGIEIHSAGYIGNGKEGRSWGCFAVTPDAMQVLLTLIPYNIEMIAYH